MSRPEDGFIFQRDKSRVVKVGLHVEAALVAIGEGGFYLVVFDNLDLCNVGGHGGFHIHCKDGILKGVCPVLAKCQSARVFRGARR